LTVNVEFMNIEWRLINYDAKLLRLSENSKAQTLFKLTFVCKTLVLD